MQAACYVPSFEIRIPNIDDSQSSEPAGERRFLYHLGELLRVDGDMRSGRNRETKTRTGFTHREQQRRSKKDGRRTIRRYTPRSGVDQLDQEANRQKGYR
jgi:hypothetical protein